MLIYYLYLITVQWFGKNCQKGEQNKRLKLQKRACKIIDQYSNNGPVPVMCYKTIIMPFDVCVKCHTRIQVFHILNGSAPEYLNDKET